MAWSKHVESMVWQDQLRHLGAAVWSTLYSGPEKSSRENKVAYLDGLRGFAAFLVYCTHHTAFGHDHERRLHHSFGFRDEYLFAALPIVRLFFVGGAYAVALFFVISGYAISIGPLTMIQKQGTKAGSRLAMQLGSSFPRRWVRLYVPVIVTTFVFMSSWHIFSIESSNPANSGGPADTYVEEVNKWLNEFIEGSYVFMTSAGFGQSEYNPHMWSIAVEYRGSAIVYIAILSYYALGYGPSARFYAGLLLFAYFQLIADGPYYALFVIGTLLCDMGLVAENNPQQLPRVLRFSVFQNHTWIYYPLLVLGLYLGSAPHILDANNLVNEPGWAFLSYFAPRTSTNARWYYCVYSAVLCVISVPRIPWLKRMFESSVFQYLGRISFGFYLVHGPVMWIIGDRLNAAVGRPRATAGNRISDWINIFPISDRGPLGLEINFLLPHLILLPLTLFLGSFVTRTLDTPSVRLSKYFFQQRSQKQEEVEFKHETETLLPR